MFKSLSNAVRFLSIHMVGKADSGHLGMPLGMADSLTCLFKNFLIYNPENPQWPNRDRFVLSGGHGSSALYALLYLTGYKNMSLNQLQSFRKLGSKTAGHPEYDLDCGIEITTGMLGQGIANAVGMALEERLLNARLGDDCINHYTYVSVGDGDLMEGVAAEASAIAGHLSLGRLIVLFDDNNITIDGEVGVSSSENILQRYESYGWHTLAANGHSENEINAAFESARQDQRPSLIALKTRIGYGTPRENSPEAHHGALTEQEIEATREKLDWHYGPFEVPEYLAQTWKIIGKRSHKACEEWQKTQSEKYGSKCFGWSEEMTKIIKKIKKDYFISRPFEATRVSFKEVLSQLMKESNFLLSGSCDLGSATGCLDQSMTPISKNDFSGNYIHYGVREHAMGAIMNGIAIGKKIRCCGGTFLAFSDYMRPAIRMSALMNVPTIFVFSHDSIGVGEDGATHQPVEQLTSLRGIPNLNVFRPADALETLECLECALKSEAPSALILSRQDLLSVRFSGGVNLCENGGYLIYENGSVAGTMVTLIATGSEVSIALEVKKMLDDSRVTTNVTSLPCWNLLNKQDAAYRFHVLGSGLRVGIEASNGFGWDRYLGRDDLFFGVNDFGKSCSCADAYRYFGLTAINIYEGIMRKLDELDMCG
ncbi:MAG: transketolase [Holosporaceae bacterium]|jgi:transketolase|nr:transketolase [Holosporaceae bacterium]